MLLDTNTNKENILFVGKTSNETVTKYQQLYREKLQPKIADFLLNIAYCYEMNKNFQEAKDYYYVAADLFIYFFPLEHTIISMDICITVTKSLELAQQFKDMERINIFLSIYEKVKNCPLHNISVLIEAKKYIYASEVHIFVFSYSILFSFIKLL